MQIITTVTQKGQVTLPKEFRDKLGISGYDKVYVEEKSDHIRIKPTFDLFDLVGTFYPRKNKNKTVLAARKVMEKKYKRF